MSAFGDLLEIRAALIIAFETAYFRGCGKLSAPLM
jgi:hypothetical protein